MSTIEVMRKALEALEHPQAGLVPHQGEWRSRTSLAIDALRAELERLDAVEPGAWGRVVDGEVCDIICPSEHAREPGSYTVPLYTVPIAPSIPALAPDELSRQVPEALYTEDDRGAFMSGARWAYSLAAQRAGVQIKDTLQELADDARQIGLEY